MVLEDQYRNACEELKDKKESLKANRPSASAVKADQQEIKRLENQLDKALTKYYALLVDRQNLIEETGLLNQQNEELKTLLNQYLQAGVNHDLQVPPTQVIRLDI